MFNEDEKKILTENIVAQVENLPPLPQNICRLRRAAADPDVNYDMIVPIVKEDPSLCADLLRIANSARYGVGHRVETIDEAVRYFGMPSLIEFTAAACSERIIKKFFMSIRGLHDYLLHSRQISLASGIICRTLGFDTHAVEVFSVGGLLHDIGRLVIMLVANEKYTHELIGGSWEDVKKHIACEKELYGLNHAELGMKICTKWQFPDTIVKSVQRHHTPLVSGDFSMEGLIIFLGEVIALDNLPETVLCKSLPDDLKLKVKLTDQMLINARGEYIKSKAQAGLC